MRAREEERKGPGEPKFQGECFVKKQRLLVIVVVAAAITPSGDPFSLFALAVPMYLFYELSIFLGWLFVRTQRRRAEKAEKTEKAAAAARSGAAAQEQPPADADES